MAKNLECELSQCMDGDLNLEALISVYVKENQHEFSEDDFKNIRLADVIASVNAENGNSKSIKKSKRKSSSAKITAKRSIQPAAKKKKPRLLFVPYFTNVKFVYLIYLVFQR